MMKFSIMFGIAPRIILFKTFERTTTRDEALQYIRKNIRIRESLQLYDQNWKLVQENERLNKFSLYIIRRLVK